jgi:hypothetical protein
MSHLIPSRFVTQGAPGSRELRLATFLTRSDPLADAVIDALVALPKAQQELLVARMLSASPGALPAALTALREDLLATPLWFDEARSDRGGAVLLRSGVLSGLVLAFKSLVLGYCAPAGNKPLAFSGRLTGAGVSKRLGETARFVEAVSQPRGLKFAAPGFVAAVKVRLIHARVRHALVRSPVWRADDWGAPINQYDMAGTVLLFSSVLIEGLRQLGAHVSAAEEDATLHQWRRVGQLMGVDDELLSTSPGEAHALWAMLEATQGLPDRDSRRLTHALILSGAEGGAPQRAIDFGYALCRALIGSVRGDALGLPRSAWDVAPKLIRRVVGPVDLLARRVPGAQARALGLGARYWRRTIELALGNAEVLFELPVEPLAG